MIVVTTQNFLPDIGGIQIYMTGLADALAARDHRLAVFCDGHADPADAEKPYQVVRFAGPRPWSRWRKSVAVQRVARKGGIRAVVADSWKSLELLPGGTLRGARVVCIAHGAELLVTPQSSKARRIARALAKADVVASNSDFTSELVKPLLSGGTVSRVVLPGLYPPLTMPKPRISHGGARLLTIARLDAYKGVDVMLHAIAALKPRHPSIRYDVVGTGVEAARLRALCTELGLDAVVQFHGSVSESGKARLLEEADIFALPSRREPGEVEGFGIVYVEAGAYGLPCVAGRGGGTANAVLDGETGLLVDGADKDDVAHALSRLIEDGALATRMGEAGRKRFWDEFVWDASIARFEKILFDPL